MQNLFETKSTYFLGLLILKKFDWESILFYTLCSNIMLTMADGSNIKISFARFLVNNMAFNPFIYQTLFSKVGRIINLVILKIFKIL